MHQMWSKNLEFFNALTFHELTQESIKVYSDFHFVCSRLGNSNSCFNQFVCKNQGSTTYSRNKLFNHNCLKQILTVNQNHTIYTCNNSKCTILFDGEHIIEYTPYFAECPMESNLPSPDHTRFLVALRDDMSAN